MKLNKTNLTVILLLQIGVVIYALSSVAGKFASRYEFLSLGFILSYGFELFLLGVYAILWQQVIKKVDISVAYVNKAMTVFWSMLFASLFFKEVITLRNIIGVVLIAIGTIVVNKDV